MANKNNGNGTAARKRGKWTGGHPMRKCHVYKMLANPLYAARIRADSEVVAANHARAVDDRTFDLVQEKLKENTRNPGTQHRPKLECLLRGLLYCTCCGSAMSPSYSSSKQRRYRYYVCIRATQRNGDGCTTRAVSAPVVEEAVIESVRHFVLAPEVVERRVSSTLRHPAWEFTDFLPLLLGRVRLVSGVEHHLAVGQDGLGVAE